MENPFKSTKNIKFHGEKDSTFWDYFIRNTNYLEENLYELKSIKMLNIYSLIFNNSIKEMILEDLFSTNKKSKLLSKYTWETLQELSVDNINELKQNLSNTFDSIIKNNWLNFVKSYIDSQLH